MTLIKGIIDRKGKTKNTVQDVSDKRYRNKDIK